ncbi:bromodomain adjacent to zinc finger domain protein 2A-like [Alexandromys fortis]|uniref:bromodomain adjacent to zinc finger domain protein 2A-like n=1 Tax=Alexandromys fortis TaxID=100897 RepID=UPI0021529883|nr:bromodomain adjacent to zinc finger domain protein 2A-like [Microtus fortis]
MCFSGRWRREVRIKKGCHRWQGETWYYGPCGKRMKQFPEVIKYLSRNVVHSVRREHFSFSPRMPVGDFFEERDTPEGLQWVQLSAEEIPSRIQAITGKRGRPRNNEKAKNKEVPKVKRGRGRPPKVKIPELLNKTDNRLPKKLETQGTVLLVAQVFCSLHKVFKMLLNCSWYLVFPKGTDNWKDESKFVLPLEGMIGILAFATLFFKYLFIYFIMYTIFYLCVSLQARRGHQTSLQMVVSHHVVAGN